MTDTTVPQKLDLATPLITDDLAAIRTERKSKLAGALRIFGRLGFGEGVAGHITARDPERTDCFWVNPFGMSFRHVSVSDLILVNHLGEVVEGDRPVNRAAFVIHAAVHEARPDVMAAAHAHSLYGKALSSLGRGIDPITRWCRPMAARSCSTRRLAKPWPPAWGTTRPPSTRTTGSSPSARRSTRPPGGSSPWSAQPRLN